jgi:hypothetical protein
MKSCALALALFLAAGSVQAATKKPVPVSTVRRNSNVKRSKLKMGKAARAKGPKASKLKRMNAKRARTKAK